jgi:vitamin B12 transporter
MKSINREKVVTFANLASFTLVFFSFLSIQTLAQSDTGAQVIVHVTDSQNAVVVKAEVSLYTRDNRLQMKSLTDNSGICRFQQLAPGEYLITAEALGFGRAPTQSLRVARNAEAEISLVLPLAAVNEQVVVTAQGTAQPVDEVSKAVSVIDLKQIDERDESSIAEALRNVPGLRVQQLGGPGSFTSIKTRGLRNEDTAVLVDGLRFRDTAAPQGDASGFLEDLIVTDVSRVEVLRGSGSSLYGSNAIGGVINVVTNEGGGPLHGNLLAEGGGLGMFRGRGQLAGGARRDAIVFSAGFSHLNVARGLDDQDEYRNSSGQGRVVFRLAPTATLSARIYGANSRLQLNNSPVVIGNLPATGIVEATPLSLSEQRRYESGAPLSQLNIGDATFIPDANDPDNLRKANFFSGAVTFSQRLTEAFGYDLIYQGLRTNRTLTNGPLGVGFQPFGGTDQSDFEGRVHLFSGRFDLHAGDINLITGGYEFESETFRNRAFPADPLDNSTVDVTQTSNSFYVQDQLRFLDDRLQISAAFRAQFFSLKQPKFTPADSAPYNGIEFQSPPTAYTGDGSIAYFFRSETKLRAHVGNGYRAPSLFERFGSSFSGLFGYSVFGDPRLRPDRSIAFDAGIDQALFKNRLRASATYFYTRLQEVIVFDVSGAINPATDPFGRFIGYINSNGGIARGMEASVTTAPTRTLDLTASYTYTKSLQRKPQVAGVLRSLVIPDHQFALTASQRFGRRILVNFDLAVTSDYLAPVLNSITFASRAYRFRGLGKADLGASYTLPFNDSRSLRFFGYVENLFNRENFESGFRTPGRTGRAGASFIF